MKRSLIALLALIALVVALVPVASARLGATTATTMTVTGKEFSFALTKKSAPKGVIVFQFVNRGNLPHDFKIAGKKTPIIKKGKSATLRVTIQKAGRYPYVCTVPGHAAAGMRGVFAVR